MKEKIILAHPLQQHSYRTAEALDKAGLLKKYITTVYYDENRRVYKVLEKILGKDNVKRMHGRTNKVIEKYLKTYNEILGLLYLFIIRIDKYKIIEPKLYSFLTNRFGKNVYKYIDNNKETCVIMYDTTAYKCFKLLNKKNHKIIKIIDMSSATIPYIRKILLSESKKRNMKYTNSLKVNLKFYTDKKAKKQEKELQYTDYFLVPSNFVKKSLIECGIQEKKILYVPYGVDLTMFNQKQYSNVQNSKLVFLFVGRVEVAKGIYYLIKAFQELEELDIELRIVGNMSSKDEKMYEDIEKSNNIIYYGPKRKEELNKIYMESDVYIMPSLFEGFSLTLLEAMSSGLPVIATKSSGAEGVIQDYKEGIVINPSSVEELKEKIIWFYNNREQIPIMGRNARKLAEQYTWENYNRNLEEKLKCRLKA